MTDPFDGRLHIAEDLQAAGVPLERLLEAERAGTMLRPSDDTWISTPGFLATGNGIEYAVACLRHPGSIICLLSACAWHDVSDELPNTTWTSASADVPSIAWAGPDLTVGVDAIEIYGVTVRITNACRTVVDMLRARGDIGDEPARAALMDWRERGGEDADLLAMADALGCEDQVRFDLDNVPPLDLCWP